ncbi:MAG: hypothetical protein H0X27_07860 [Caulobacteraceae bacterium]|nr:hypothetical protein [Caulobacteraceae bacterium]
MPVLQNFRHEAFAKARAAGARLQDAYEDAGFVSSVAHACRLASQPEVAERIAELRRERSAADDAGPEAIIAALVRMATDGEAAKTPAGVKEARQSLVDAFRLRKELAWDRNCDRHF